MTQSQSTYRKLIVWQKSVVLAQEIYSLSATFPASERYGLVSQMQRAAVSIASNIAEGSGRNGRKEFVQFLYIAQGSACELETQMEIAHRIGYLDSGALDRVLTNIIEVKMMLTSLQSSLLR